MFDFNTFLWKFVWIIKCDEEQKFMHSVLQTVLPIFYISYYNPHLRAWIDKDDLQNPVGIIGHYLFLEDVKNKT